MVKNPPAMRETWAQSLGWEDPLEEDRKPSPVFLPGESPWVEKPGRLHIVHGSQRAGHHWATKHTLLINTGFILPLLVLNPHLLL